MKKLFGFFAVAALAITLTMSSCSKEETWTDTENFVFGTYKDMRDGALGGHSRCYSVIFPVTILFPDETSQQVGDREELITVIKAWKEANPDAEERPTIEFPVSVETADGDTIVVESIEQAKELRKRCRKGRNAHKAFRHIAKFINNSCYKVDLPIALVYENGEIEEINNRGDIAKLIKKWKAERPDEVPEIVYPITITLKETQEDKEIASFEELQAVIETCK